ncbi:MAG: hypothetical protein COA78_27930 [Blastopirellula sp.]|nr:MAG: hypothetical protein COA78_27930 [Blastopirellula sp.]
MKNKSYFSTVIALITFSLLATSSIESASAGGLFGRSSYGMKIRSGPFKDKYKSHIEYYSNGNKRVEMHSQVGVSAVAWNGFNTALGTVAGAVAESDLLSLLLKENKELETELETKTKELANKATGEDGYGVTITVNDDTSPFEPKPGATTTVSSTRATLLAAENAKLKAEYALKSSLQLQLAQYELMKEQLEEKKKDINLINQALGLPALP